METKISVSKKYEPVVREWQQALESGKYYQIQGTLVSDDGDNSGYCCLGVFCKMHELPNYENHYDFLNYYKEDEVINQKAMLFNDFLKIEVNAGEANLQSIFMSLNDDDGKSFSEISQWINENISFE